MDATWHARPRGSATRAHAAPTRRCDAIYIYIYMGVTVHIVFQLSEDIINPTNPSHLINTFVSFNFSRVGLSPTQYLSAGHVAKGEASDRQRIGNPCVDGVDSRSTGDHHRTCFK